MQIDMKMVSDRDGLMQIDENNTIGVSAGTSVEYIAHVPGGCVRVRLENGTEGVMNPNCFAQLR